MTAKGDSCHIPCYDRPEEFVDAIRPILKEAI